MTTKELYSAIGVAGYEHLACWRKDGVFCLRMAAPASCYRCPQCGNREVIRRGTYDRVVHAPPVGKERTLLFIRAPRLECRICQRVLNAYYLKEDLGQIWQQPDKVMAERFLNDWCSRARASGIKVLLTMANTLQGYRTGILNRYDFPISSGPLEGINNKIGALQRMACGYRDHEYFVAKLYALHLAKFALIG